MADLIEALRLRACGGDKLLEEAAAALEATREDAERWRFVRDSTACSLSLTHNDHHVVYQSAADTLDDPQGYYNDLPDGERERMIEQDSIWTLHVYPNSPVGFNVYHGATLDAAIDQARGKENWNG